MDTANSTATAPQSTRELRALDLYRKRGHLIRRVASEVYEVPSCTMQGRRYIVRYGGETESCTCKDFEFGHSAACKHLLAVGVHHAKRRGESRRRRARHTCQVCGEPSGSVSKGTGRPLVRDGDRWFHTSCRPIPGVEEVRA